MTANQKIHQAGFTLVELLVSLVIVAILSSLTLSGLARLRSQAKVDKTTTTIRKLHEIVWPLVGGICTRRLEEPSGSSFFVAPSGLTGKRLRAWQRRELIRRQQILEMPETWNEVADMNPANGAYVLPAAVATALSEPITTPLDTVTSSRNFTAPVKAFAARKDALNPSADYASAECLFMIVTFSGDPDILDTFHAGEIGDKDGDGAPEFHDGLGKPILFMRWAPGIAYSHVQEKDPRFNPDLTDVTGQISPLLASSFTSDSVDDDQDGIIDEADGSEGEYGLVPLIWSGGADDALNDWSTADPGYGFRASNSGWLPALMAAATGSSSAPFAICQSRTSGIYEKNGQSLTPNAADNITNHAIPLR